MTKGYFALFLFLETGILGVFLSLDFFLFYVFFEVSLLPMYFLIGIWGGPRKEYAAIKFFLYTLVGSIGLLIVLIGTYLYSRARSSPAGTFDLVTLASPRVPGRTRRVIGGARRHRRQDVLRPADVRVPDQGAGRAVPHLAARCPCRSPDADQHDPRRLLLKMGGYGIFRIAYPLFPEAAKALWLLVRDHRRGQHHLRRAVRDGPDRFQEAGRLLLRLATWASSRSARR